MGQLTRRHALLAAAAVATGGADAKEQLAWDFSFPSIEDGILDLAAFRGRVLLVVNTASFCGFTPQYKSLEALYSKYRERGFVVLGFPSNDFSQEPGDGKAIADFCENTYGVKFPMFIKSRVADSAGAQKSALFAELKQITGDAPSWNFHKYLIARDGKTVQSFGSMTSPDSSSFVKNVEKLLDAK